MRVQEIKVIIYEFYLLLKNDENFLAKSSIGSSKIFPINIPLKFHILNFLIKNKEISIVPLI